jgi:hypothetical protein
MLRLQVKSREIISAIPAAELEAKADLVKDLGEVVD